MARLFPIARDALAPDQRRFHDAVRAIRRRPISGPFIVTMNSSPDLAARFAHLGHYFHARGQADESIVSIRARAYISLIGSRALDAPYEWGAWVNWALDAGVPQATVDAIRVAATPESLTHEEALADELCTQLISGNHRISAPTFNAALQHFGPQGLVEVVLTLGYFAMIALPLNAFEIEMTSEQQGLRKPYAPLIVRENAAVDYTTETRRGPPLSAAQCGSSARLPQLQSHDDVAPEHQHFVDRIVRTRGCISPVFQILLHTPDAAERVAHVGDFFLFHSGLSPAISALTCLIAAREIDSDYAWAASVNAARAAGLDAGTIEAIEHGKPLTRLSCEQKVLVDFCYPLLRGNHHVGDSAYEAAVIQFGVAATVQIAGTLGYVLMLGWIANAFDIPILDDSAKPAL